MRKDTKLKPLDLFTSEGRKPENFLEIILVLANQGPMIKNEVAKVLGKREGDISRRIDWLNEFGFIEVARERTKKTRYRTIRFKEYRPTLKGILAISHLPQFDPIQTLQCYEEIPEIARNLLTSFGSEDLKLYINRVGNKVQESVDQTPLFEEIGKDDPSLYWQLIMHGLKELSTIRFRDKTQEIFQRLLTDYLDAITPMIDTMINQLEEQTEALRKINQLLIEAKEDPTKIRELFQAGKDTALMNK